LLVVAVADCTNLCNRSGGMTCAVAWTPAQDALCRACCSSKQNWCVGTPSSGSCTGTRSTGRSAVGVDMLV
jgi:hypothetical protein